MTPTTIPIVPKIKTRQNPTALYVEKNSVIDGKVSGSTMKGKWNHAAGKGDFKITKK